MKIALMSLTFLAFAAAAALAQTAEPTANETKPERVRNPQAGKTLNLATFGGGCFWCVEAVFQELKGVHQVVSGYAGGHVTNPTYEMVLTGKTGHAEVVQIAFDPDVITYAQVLEIFWKTHDPTTLNRQGPDIGPQYRSIILAHDDEQLKQAEYYKGELNKAKAFSKPVVTEIVPLTAFYPAEAYHQNYFRRNPQQQYCQFVIMPKMQKFRRVFRDQLK
ncbi:peptide-methionine (S)-S-oxide reductase MsrA [soil metagenome]